MNFQVFPIKTIMHHVEFQSVEVAALFLPQTPGETHPIKLQSFKRHLV